MIRVADPPVHAAVAVDGVAVDGREVVLGRLHRLIEEHLPYRSTADFLGAQFDAGLAFVHFPEGHGGLGLSRDLQPVIDWRLRDAGAPCLADRNPMGYGMAAPTILAQGSEAQKYKYLRRIFTCEEIWCHLFFTPGAGSDDTGAGSDDNSLATRAVPDGDEWVLSGRKVWSTLAHAARYGLVLAQTDPESPKHKGLTYFVMDMQAPGVEVRPLRQLTGEADFNEICLSEVRIPDSERLSEVGDGWRAALSTLMTERVSSGGIVPPRSGGPIGVALELWANCGRNPLHHDRLVGLWIEAEVQRLTNIQTNVHAAGNAEDGVSGSGGFGAKSNQADLSQRIYEFCADLLRPEGTGNIFEERRSPIRQPELTAD